MAKRIATVTGTALVPGVSKNGRLYTRELIAKAVESAQGRIGNGSMYLTDSQQPLTQRTHHAADDDSTALVGRLTSLTLAEDGSAKFTADIADTDKGRTIAALADTSDGQPPFLRGVSIRGAWDGEPRRVMHEGRSVETGDGLILDGLDYTAKPGVTGAVIDSCVPVAESEPDGRTFIFESVQEATVTAEVAEAAAPLKSGKPATPQTKASSYADPGYQPDRMKRYALDTKKQAKAAWGYVHQADNAKNYTANQLKRIKGRIKAALKKFGVEISAEEGWIIDQIGQVTEHVTEHYMGDEYDASGSFCISLSNGPVNLTISSYCVDPADLDVIGRAAMAAACNALTDLDPDMDGDIDVPGADSEDTDHDAGSGDQMETAAPTPELVAETQPAEDPGAPASVTAPPAPDPAAETTTTREEPAVSEPTTPAVETPAAPAADTSGIDALSAKFDKLTDMLGGLVTALKPTAPATAAESAPAPAAAPAVPSPAAVAETEDQRITRLVEERVTARIQDLVESGQGPGRKGLTQPVTEADAAAGSAGEGLNSQGLPADWPDKPLHTYTAEERKKYFGPTLEQYALGSRASR